jgi:hypothetical protein
MKIFGWKSAGRAQSRPAHLSVPLDPRFRSVGEWPRSYEAQVREGYLENPVAQRAVRLVAEGVASIRQLLRRASMRLGLRCGRRHQFA